VALLLLQPLVTVGIVGNLMSGTVLRVTAQHPVHPTDLLSHRDVHTGHVLLSTTHSEGHDPYLGVDGMGGVGGVLGADQRTSSVTTTGVTAGLTTSADKGGVKSEFFTKFGLPEPTLTLVRVDHGDINLLHNNRPRSFRTKVFLAPALDKTFRSVVKVLLIFRKTNCVHMLVQDEVSLEEEDSNRVP